MPSPFRRRPSRYTDARPWAPMTDAEWEAVAPFLRRGARGRPIEGGARARVDAIFRVVSQKLPWQAAGQAGVPADTVSRQFRRWAKAGVFARMLKVVAKSRRAKGVPEALRAMEHWICAAHRRSVKVCGVRAIALARRLGLLSALPGPSWLLPDPILSKVVGEEMAREVLRGGLHWMNRADLALWDRLIRFVGGARRIPRCLVPA